MGMVRLPDCTITLREYYELSQADKDAHDKEMGFTRSSPVTLAHVEDMEEWGRELDAAAERDYREAMAERARMFFG